MAVEHVTSSALRRRQRRLCQWLRHERMTVAMSLAEATHHAAPRRQKPASAITVEYFELSSDEEVALARRMRPASLAEPRGARDRVLRHTVKQIIETFVPVPMLDLDAPVPQMVDQLVDVLKLLDTAIPEQVIAVPKIPLDATVLFERLSPPRRWRSRWWKCPCWSVSRWHAARAQMALLGAASRGACGWCARTIHKRSTASPGRYTNTGRRSRPNNPGADRGRGG